MSGAPAAIADALRMARNGGRVVLFGIPARPVEIDVAEALIFKNLTVSAISGREIFATWYRSRWLLEHGVVDLRPLITERAAARRLRARVRAARVGRGLQDRAPPGRGRAQARRWPRRPTRRPANGRLPGLGKWAHR